MTEYLTIKENSVSNLEIKKSKFITNLIKINSEAEANEQLELIKKEHYKANHSCSAYILGERSDIRHSSDNGEPSGTAGAPMLNVLSENQLTNTLAVVTRYFGGIKLGTGGLIRAYTNSVVEALKENQIVRVISIQELHITLPYNLLDNLKYDLNYEISDITYSDQIQMTILVPIEEVEVVEQHLQDKFNNRLQFNSGKIKTAEIPIKKD